MILNLTVNDAAGKSRGSVRMGLDFGKKQWFVADHKPVPWQHVGFSKTGSFELKDWGVGWIWDQEPGGKKRTTIIFWNPPKSELDFKNLSGRARLYDPKVSAF